MFAFLKIFVSALTIIVLGGGLYISSQRAAIIEKVLKTAEESVSKTLGVPIKIGSVDFDNVDIFNLDKNSDVTIHNLEIFDKKNELLAKVDTTKVNFKLIALRDDPVSALDTIWIDGVQLNLLKRDDESWNFNDIKLESRFAFTFKLNVVEIPRFIITL